MKSTESASKITARHLARKAVVYLRQSSIAQVRHNVESQRLQYALKDTAKAYGFAQVEVIDVDLGMSASSGAQVREGFKQLLASVALGAVGIVLSREPSRLSRTDKDWCHLMELCRVLDTLIACSKPWRWCSAASTYWAASARRIAGSTTSASSCR